MPNIVFLYVTATLLRHEKHRALQCDVTTNDAIEQ